MLSLRDEQARTRKGKKESQKKGDALRGEQTRTTQKGKKESQKKGDAWSVVLLLTRNGRPLTSQHHPLLLIP